MRKIFSVIVIILFTLFFRTMAFSKSADSFFADLRAQNIKLLPESFSARISGKTINRKLSAIPKSAYLDVKKNIWVKLDYSKSNSISIVVANTDELYRDLFSQYVRFFTLGPVLSDTPLKSILEQYDISYKMRGKKTAVLKLGIKGAQNYFLLYVDSDSKKVQRVDYYMGKKIMSSTILKYVSKSHKGKIFRLPSMFFVKVFSGKDRRPEIFRLDRFSIK